LGSGSAFYTVQMHPPTGPSAHHMQCNVSILHTLQISSEESLWDLPQRPPPPPPIQNPQLPPPVSQAQPIPPSVMPLPNAAPKPLPMGANNPFVSVPPAAGPWVFHNPPALNTRSQTKRPVPTPPPTLGAYDESEGRAPIATLTESRESGQQPDSYHSTHRHSLMQAGQQPESDHSTHRHSPTQAGQQPESDHSTHRHSPTQAGQQPESDHSTHRHSLGTQAGQIPMLDNELSLEI